MTFLILISLIAIQIWQNFFLFWQVEIQGDPMSTRDANETYSDYDMDEEEFQEVDPDRYIPDKNVSPEFYQIRIF